VDGLQTYRPFKQRREPSLPVSASPMEPRKPFDNQLQSEPELVVIRDIERVIG
jgi:hypothetical protein